MSPEAAPSFLAAGSWTLNLDKRLKRAYARHCSNSHYVYSAFRRPAMDRQQISLKLTLDALGLPLRLDSFDDRMVLQKTIYLCQFAGVHLGYRYNWYHRGPYSPELTRDAFELEAKLATDFDETAGSRLDDASIQRLMKVMPLWSSRRAEERPRWLELLASVLFLKRSYDG